MGVPHFNSSLGVQLVSCLSPFGPIEIRESDKYRWVHTGSSAVQGAVFCPDPNKLVLDYTQAMQVFRLFKDSAKRGTLILGAGTGALARQARLDSPNLPIAGVDHNAKLIELAQEFFYCNGLYDQLVDRDVAVTVPILHDASFDVIHVDLFDGNNVPEIVFQESFMAECRRVLDDSGICIFNLILTGENNLKTFLLRARNVFDRRVLCFDLPEIRNVVVIAGKPDSMPVLGQIDWTELTLRAAQLQNVSGYDFPRFLRRIQRYWMK